MCQKQVTRGCIFLPTNGIHDYLVEGLNKSIMVRGVDWNSDGRGCICEVQCYLARKYGGPPERFTQWQTKQDVYVVQIPAEIPTDTVIREGAEWAYESGWLIKQWNIMKKSYQQFRWFKIHIRITEFPLEFWHPFFLNMVLAEFGEAYRLDEENMWGETRTEINAYMTIIDPKRVPFSTTLPFLNRWKECFFEIISWEYEGDQPHEARYEPNDEEDARTSLLKAHEKLMQ